MFLNFVSLWKKKFFSFLIAVFIQRMYNKNIKKLTALHFIIAMNMAPEQN